MITVVSRDVPNAVCLVSNLEFVIIVKLNGTIAVSKDVLIGLIASIGV